MIDCVYPAPIQRGASRSSRHVGAGRDGRTGVQDEARMVRRRNRAVPIPRRWDQTLCDERKATVARQPGAPRRPRISRKTIAQGVPGVSAALWFLACAMCTLFCTQGSRVRPASGAPCALRISEGHRFGITRTQIAPRECGRVPSNSASFRGAPFGASPESITTGRRCCTLAEFRAQRCAVVVMDSGLSPAPE